MNYPASRWLVVLTAVVAAGLTAPVAQAATCDVPSASYPTIAVAVLTPACTTMQLAAGTYAEDVRINRDLAVLGAGSASTIVAGALLVSGATTDVTVAALRVDGTGAGIAGCWPSLLLAHGGAEVMVGVDVDVRNAGGPGTGCRLCRDGFESGDTSGWSAVWP